MEKIASFKVDHLNLFPGLYLSRRDRCGGVCVTTFDMRLTAPNREPPVISAALHTVEHLGATYLRNGSRKQDIVYFGPMGCRTGFYLVTFGEEEPKDIYPLILELCDFIINFEGEIPGASPEQCGNYAEQDLPEAKRVISRYKDELLKNARFEYPSA